MSPIDKNIGGALTTEGGSNVSGRAGVIRGAQPSHQANPEGASGYRAGSGSTVTGNPPEAQEVSSYPRQPQGNYVVDGAIDTHLLGTDPIGAQKGKNGPEKQKFLCAHCRKKSWVIDSEAGCAAEMTHFTRCMFCVVEKRDERARMQLQAALLKEMEYLRKSIEQSLSIFEAKIEERTPARSGEASHSRAGEAATEDLRKELSSLSESMCTESLTECGPRLLGPLLNLNRQRQRLWLLLRELPGLRQIFRVMPRRLAPRVEMRRRSSRMPGCGWLKKPLAPTSDLSARFLKPHPGRSSLPKIMITKRDAEGDGGRGPWPKRLLLLLGSSANALDPQTSWFVTRWWPGRQGGFFPSSGLPIAPGRFQARGSRGSQRR